MSEPIVSPTSDKTGWPDGPWLSEPEAVRCTTTAGLPGLVRRVLQGGSYGGDVAVPPGHPYHGQGSDEPPVAVHGGLTYAGPCRPELGVCHVPAAGEPEAVWWLGFDTAHYRDYQPGLVTTLRRAGRAWGLGDGTVYRDLTSLRAEVESLATQLAALATPAAAAPLA